MADTNRTEINTLGEFELINRLVSKFETVNQSTIRSVGDDGAVMDYGPDKQVVVSTDLLIENIHFDLMYSPLKHLGYKSVVVNLSDIYAMNATPEQITVSIAVSNRFSLESLEELYEGIHAACRHYNVDLVGGDTSSSNKGLIISVTAIGQGAKGDIVYRNTAQPGDLICVSGDLGGAFIGMQILEREKALYLDNPGIKPELADYAYVVGRQLKPEARGDVIKTLKAAGIKPTAMIDVSDGLASEIIHICSQSNVGAVIQEAKVPIHSMTEELAVKFRMDPITCALNGGEDYELLFTIDPEDMDKIQFLDDVYIIGNILTEKDGIMLETSGGNFHRLKAQGWQHFNQ
ncbi:MAG TPA: thiamine-phosphate kinase [Saprospiraceae bacterium]|jgi:thiamine-monophosphate kinase|nr:MAG: thiamine-monophosphate kinase [Candidatus Parvibacillus calidus]MCC7147671.1 thiamine-phosphate kinase [Saprospiraceae bacterium]QLH28032.1 MAG: thiamine-phosphate kinase [Candidatus Parvibacillus calidus]WKZ61829.1 MAG: thiamine-phosphate kinase [Saprospiraceae bacterium]HRN34146.1 thiamine-phosphate kinase [Saprospiraceae bacterium]